MFVELNIKYKLFDLIVEGYYIKGVKSNSRDVPDDKPEFNIKTIKLCESGFGEVNLIEEEIEKICLEKLRK